MVDNQKQPKVLKQINFTITIEDDKKLQYIKLENLLTSNRDAIIFLIRNYKLNKEAIK